MSLHNWGMQPHLYIICNSASHSVLQSPFALYSHPSCPSCPYLQQRLSRWLLRQHLERAQHHSFQSCRQRDQSHARGPASRVQLCQTHHRHFRRPTLTLHVHLLLPQVLPMAKPQGGNPHSKASASKCRHCDCFVTLAPPLLVTPAFPAPTLFLDSRPGPPRIKHNSQNKVTCSSGSPPWPVGPHHRTNSQLCESRRRHAHQKHTPLSSVR